MRFRVLLICATLILATGNAFAAVCSCGPAADVLTSYEKAAAVLIGKVISVETNKSGYEGAVSARILVEKVYKGNIRVHDEVVFLDSVLCGPKLHQKFVGLQFLLYAHTPKVAGEGWVILPCDRSRPVEYAREDILYLDNMDRLRGKTRVSGNYTGAFAAKPEDLANKTIRFVGEKKTYETKTDANGVYEIYDLPPGKYTVEAEAPRGWRIYSWVSAILRELPQNTSPVFTLPPERHVSLDVIVQPVSVVEGTIVGPDGNPLEGVCPALLETDLIDKRYKYDCTDEQGRFRLDSVAPGTYYLVVNPDGKLSSDEPFTRLFYPGVTEPEKAALITITGGETVSDINLVIPKLAEMITVSGVLRFSNNKPADEELVQFKAITQDGISGDVDVLTDTKGRFTLKILKGAKGEVYGEFRAYREEYENCPKLDALVKAAGAEPAQIKTPAIKIEGEHNTQNLALKFPFPKCKLRE